VLFRSFWKKWAGETKISVNDITPGRQFEPPSQNEENEDEGDDEEAFEEVDENEEGEEARPLGGKFKFLSSASDESEALKVYQLFRKNLTMEIFLHILTRISQDKEYINFPATQKMELLKEIIEKSIEMAKHSGRQSITKNDVEMALAL
jgi:hypothetical protein